MASITDRDVLLVHQRAFRAFLTTAGERFILVSLAPRLGAHLADIPISCIQIRARGAIPFPLARRLLLLLSPA